MKFPCIGLMTILLVATIVFTGCSDSTPSSPLVSTPPGTSNITKVIATPEAANERQIATTVQTTVPAIPDKVFNGDYHWAEYRNIISVTMPPNPRSQWIYAIKMEKSTENYRGTSAIHYRFTSTSDYPELVGNNVTLTKDGQIAVHDFYYDNSTNIFLGDTMSEIIKGVRKPAVNSSGYYSKHHREASPGGYLGIEPFGEMNVSLVNLDIESVTVPAGTYPEARKYSGSFEDGTRITFWVAPHVPVPVRYQFPNKYLDGVDPFEQFDLKGWG
jgi:hypothetical protein